MIHPIERKQKNGTLEVEHILKIAKSPSKEAAELLQHLSRKYSWKRHPCFPSVPLATWAEATSEYCLNGFDGLVELAREAEKTAFVFAVLDEIGTQQALDAALSIGEHLLSEPEQDLKTSHDLASLLNFFGLRGIISEKLNIVKFLEKLLNISTNEGQSGRAICALRWYGDDASVSVIRDLSPMSEHRESARRAAIRAIRKRNRERSIPILN